MCWFTIFLKIFINNINIVIELIELEFQESLYILQNESMFLIYTLQKYFIELLPMMFMHLVLLNFFRCINLQTKYKSII